MPPSADSSSHSQLSFASHALWPCSTHATPSLGSPASCMGPVTSTVPPHTGAITVSLRWSRTHCEHPERHSPSAACSIVWHHSCSKSQFEKSALHASSFSRVQPSPSPPQKPSGWQAPMCSSTSVIICTPEPRDAAAHCLWPTVSTACAAFKQRSSALQRTPKSFCPSEHSGTPNDTSSSSKTQSRGQETWRISKSVFSG
mmetsp:Transcript_15306/g.47583  ORF Transcript_15306/g.47583 Transcript_15306/m.47583 type:complete len:200 (+) Transcript_15306:3158-3757(+)